MELNTTLFTHNINKHITSSERNYVHCLWERGGEGTFLTIELGKLGKSICVHNVFYCCRKYFSVFGERKRGVTVQVKLNSFI